MTEQTSIIPIFLCIDDKYAPFLNVALSSMIRNASKDYTYHIIVLYDELSDENRRCIEAFAGENVMIRLVSMENRLSGITDQNRLRADYVTLTIYFRLFIPVMFPEYDKGIYLDSDIVIPGDISELYQFELEDNYIGAVADHSVADVPQLVNYIENGIGIETRYYINSGVLLMNLKKLREAALEQRFLELMNTWHFDCIAPDQDYLNVMCHGKITYLPADWDAMPTQGRAHMASPKLIHYNLFAKPWYYDNVQYEEYFWDYARDTDYLPHIMDIKTRYSEEDRASDSECMKLLLFRGEEIASAKENFRTVFNEGKEKRL